MQTIPCACSSGKSYGECCENYHLGLTNALTPEQLMRSRYTAYALHLVNYLWDTTHPDKRYLYPKLEIEKWAKANQWLGLTIVLAKSNLVEFKAFYQHGLKDYVHHEKSIFKKDDGRWYYFSGEYFQ